MRRTSGWIVFGALAAGVAGVGAGEKFLPAGPAEPAPLVAEKAADTTVAQLIRDLGSDDYRTREKAGRDLAALGEKALPDMRAALLATDDAEVQPRLTVLVRKMDHERLVSPKRVTMPAEERTVKQAIDEIARQTGYRIEYGGPNGAADPKHKFEFDRTPFWVAIDRVASAAGCVVFAEYNDESIRVYSQGTINPHVAYAGPFRFLATNIHSNKSVQLSGINPQGAQNRHEYMNLNFQIQSEPKNPMLGVTQAEVIAAVDEFGGSLAPPKDPNNRSYYNNNNSFRGHNTYGNLSLTRGDKTATVIKSLKGRIGITLLSGTTPEISVADPLKVKNKTFSGRTIEIDYGSLSEDANQKGQYVVELTARKRGATDPEREDYNWSNNVWQKIELLDAAGNRYQTYGPNNSNNNGASVQLTIPFNTNDRRTGQPKKLGPPVRLVVNEWLSVTHEVTFEFKDIPLP